MTLSPSSATPAFEPIASVHEAEIVTSHLMAVMDTMLELVADETKLVRAGKLSAAARLVPSKNELSQLYLVDTQRLKASQNYIAQSAPTVLAALRKRHDEFHSVLKLNLTVLATAHAVSEGIMRGVSDHLARKVTPAGYSASGRTSGPDRRYAQPLTLSRML